MKLVDQGGFFVAENAVVCGRVSLSKGASVWYGAVVRGDMSSITVGEFTNIQDGAVLHCDPGKDLVVGRHVTVGHLAMIHAKSVGDGCLLGIHSILLSGAVVGEGCLIAAGALVKEDQVVPPRSIVVGVPGKVIGQTDDAFLRQSVDRAMRYYATARRHVDGKVDPKFMADYPPLLPEK
ncbi:MAG TPA: gamma carbonic anhydrase family protein [Planctomycetota bacterium]|nr:gamma carbonic anhydrase family protein [Planctomycetota bacterium]